MNKILRIILVITYFAIFYITKFIASFYTFSKERKLFLFVERGDDAHDNAFVMYEYFKEKGYPCKYIIAKNSNEKDKINKKDIVYFLSFKHYYTLHIAKYIISTHATNYLGIFSSEHINWYKIQSKVIFLQHGVIKNDHPNLHYGEFKCDLFLTSTNEEYAFIKDTFGYPEEVVKNLGLPRFDFLKNESNEENKIILVLPTWRLYLNDLKEKDFKKSTFYKTYCDFLTNQNLINYCKDNNYKIVLSLHSELIKFKDSFAKIGSDIVSISNLDMQYELKRANVLITDYSSVFFDFAYMLKPVIYYQFDKEEFSTHHYKPGYFDYKKDGFGDVTSSTDEIIESLKGIENFKNSKYYKREVECSFDREPNHREKVFNEILKV